MSSLLIESRPLQTRLIRLGVPLAVLLAACASFIIQPCQAQLDQQTLRFVGDVLTRNEFGDRRDDVCRKWVTAPTLSTFGPRSHHPNLVANVVRQLNECLPGDRQIKLLDKSDEAATLKVYFVPLKEFETVAGQFDFAVETDNYGFFKIWWNEKYEITKAVILIAEDRLRGNRLHHMVLEEVAQALGPAGDSNRLPDSVFFEHRRNGKYGTATRLSKLDQKILRFLYERVPTGSHAIELGVLMAQHWGE